MEVERHLDMSLDDIIAKQKKARPVRGKQQKVMVLQHLKVRLVHVNMFAIASLHFSCSILPVLPCCTYSVRYITLYVVSSAGACLSCTTL